MGRIDVFHHIGTDSQDILRAITHKLEQIMATQAELTAQITALTAKLGTVATELDKVSAETTSLLVATTALQAANADLQAQLDAAIAAGGSITQELQDAVAAAIAQGDAVAAKVASVDALVPDAPTP